MQLMNKLKEWILYEGYSPEMAGGGHKAERAAKKQTNLNLIQTAQNKERTDAANKKNEAIKAEQETLNLANEKKMNLTQAGEDARKSVYDQRNKLFADSKTILSDWEVQEKRRLQRAKTGENQVQDEDTAITGQARKDAITEMNRSDDYWKSKAQVAYDDAYQGAEKQWGLDNPSKNDTTPVQTRKTPEAKSPQAPQPPTRTRPQINGSAERVFGGGTLLDNKKAKPGAPQGRAADPRWGIQDPASLETGKQGR